MNKCLIIAEAGVNHNGELNTALKLCDAAKEAGAGAAEPSVCRTEDQPECPEYPSVKSPVPGKTGSAASSPHPPLRTSGSRNPPLFPDRAGRYGHNSAGSGPSPRRASPPR